MKFDLVDFCQRGFNYAIVDEVDSILIDEARTPLIISGPSDISTDLYKNVDRIISKFKKDEHYTVDEKARQVSLTDEGVALGENACLRWIISTIRPVSKNFIISIRP